MENLDIIFNELKLDYKQNDKYIYMACPIHNSNNPGSLNLYLNGDGVSGYWTCYTMSCNDFFTRNIIGFIRGVLSNQKTGWQQKGDRVFGFQDTINWLCKLLKLDWLTLKYETKNKSDNYNNIINYCNKYSSNNINKIPRYLIKNFSKIPAEYALKRGFA